MRCPACWRELPALGQSGIFTPTQLITRCEYASTEMQLHYGLIGQLQALGAR